MSQNRVIGWAGKVPWHLPEELRWFKQATLDQAVLMGRRTFESIGSRPLPRRLNLVATRFDGFRPPGTEVVRDLERFRPEDYAPREVWLIGGAELYAALLERCSDLYLTVVNRVVAGDTYFPPFEAAFHLAAVTQRNDDFEIRHYRRN